MTTDESVDVNERENIDTIQFIQTAGGKLMIWVSGTTIDGEPGEAKTVMTREEWDAVKKAGDTVMKRLEDS